MNLKYSSYYLLMCVGLAIAVGTLLKLTETVSLDSDFFWFLAGAGLMIEGLVSLEKQKKFDKKFKIIEREN